MLDQVILSHIMLDMSGKDAAVSFGETSATQISAPILRPLTNEVGTIQSLVKAASNKHQIPSEVKRIYRQRLLLL